MKGRKGVWAKESVRIALSPSLPFRDSPITYHLTPNTALANTRHRYEARRHLPVERLVASLAVGHPRAEQFWQSLGFSENGEFEGHQKIMVAELT